MSYSGIEKLNPRNEDNHLIRDRKLMDLLSSYHPVSLEDREDYSELLVWCLKNCQGKFRDIKANDKRIWYFQEAADAVTFSLRWV